MHHKTARDISKPLSKAKMLAHDEVITSELINKVLSWGHSRVFVYRRDPAVPNDNYDIIGVLLVKKLLSVDLAEGCHVDSVHRALKEPAVLDAEENLLSVLNKFQDGMCHLAIVHEHSKASQEGRCEGNLEVAGEGKNKPTMFCSLEDVIETMLKEDIFDEEDLELGRVSRPPVLLRAGSSLSRGGSSLSVLSLRSGSSCAHRFGRSTGRNMGKRSSVA